MPRCEVDLSFVVEAKHRCDLGFFLWCDSGWDFAEPTLAEGEVFLHKALAFFEDDHFLTRRSCGSATRVTISRFFEPVDQLTARARRDHHVLAQVGNLDRPVEIQVGQRICLQQR